METFLGDTEESTEDTPGRKKSKLKSLKTRLFGRSKKAGEASSRKLSQSTSDITAGEGLGSDEDLVCTQGIMGSRALSHDSIFLADQALTDPEPTRVLSQENVHSKIKALQEKLQQQKFYLGLPPMAPPIKRPEDQTCRSEEGAHNPPAIIEGHITTQEALNKALSQLSHNPLLPTPKPALTKPVHLILPAPPKLTSPTDDVPLDFNTPAQFTPSLDTSAARHRLSVKPRNQRASTKKRLSAVDSTALIPDLNNSETLKEEDGQPDLQEEVEMGIVDTKSPETTPVLSESTTFETTSKTSGFVSSPQDITILGKMPTVTSQILRPKAHRSADVMPAVRPHSSYFSSEVKDKSENSGNFDIQVLRDTENKTLATDIKPKMCDHQSTGLGSVLWPTVAPGETDRKSNIKRPLPGSGSFHLSVSAMKRKEEEERPRSGSFTGVREHAWIKTAEKRLDTSSPNISAKVDLKPSGGHTDVGRFEQETWETKDSHRKESVSQSKNKITDTRDSAEAVKEVEEEGGKTTFGIKLRSTSQSVRLRAEAASNEYSKSAVIEEKQQKQEISNNADQMSKKACTASVTAEAKPTDVSTAPSVVGVPAKQTPLSPVNTLPVSTEAQSSNTSKVKAGPQPYTTSAEVSWMSMAMEKTKSLQNLFTSKFPRDLTGGQSTARSQKTQVQKMNQAQANTQSQDVKCTKQPLTDAVKPEASQNKTQAQTVKQSLPTTTAQQKTPNTSPYKSNTFKEAQISKPEEMESQATSTFPQSVTQPVAQSSIWTSQSPLRCVRHVESTSQSTSGLSSSPHTTSQQPLWSTRSLRSTGLVCTPSSKDTPADCENNAANVQKKEDQPVWARSVSKTAAFLERRAEWTASPVKMKKIETLTPSETSAQVSKAGGSSEIKYTESSPRKIPERPKEEKWLQKTAAPSSSPSTSSTLSSSLQSMSDNEQPSWMELAKRKSMAWSDKTMD